MSRPYAHFAFTQSSVLKFSVLPYAVGGFSRSNRP